MSDDSMRIVSPKSAWVYVTYSEQGSMGRFNRDMIPSIKKHCFCGLCLMSEETSLLVSAGFVGLTKDKRSYLFRVLPIDYLVFTRYLLVVIK